MQFQKSSIIIFQIIKIINEHKINARFSIIKIHGHIVKCSQTDILKNE